MKSNGTGDERKFKVKNKDDIMLITLTFLLSIFSLLSFYESFVGNIYMYTLKYLFIILFIFFLIKRINKNYIKVEVLIFVTSFIIIFSSFSLFNIPSPTTSHYIEGISNIVMYTVVAILSLFIFSKLKFRKFKLIITVFLIIVTLLVTLPSLINLFDIQYYISFNDRERYKSIFNNPNELGRFSLLGVLLSLRLWFLSNSQRIRLLLTTLIFINTYLIYLSDSRTSLFSVIVLFFILFLIVVYKNYPPKLFLSFISFTSMLIILIIFYVLTYYQHLIRLDLNTLTSGRVDIWLNILYADDIDLLIGSSIILGLGSHNGYLEILSYFGIIGLFLWLIILIYLLKRKFNNVTKNKKYSSIVGFSVVILFLIYHTVEGSMVSIANLASIYFWLEISQINE